MLSRKFIKKQPGRRWLTYAAGLGLLVATIGIAGLALAVHDLVFQLDGDTSTTRGTTPTAGQTLDWDSLFNADGSKVAGAFDANATSSAFTAGTFIRDFGVKVSPTDKCNLTDTTSIVFCTGDDTTFATGSKDTLNITPGWQCNHDNNVNSKIDIMNAYAAQYLDGSSPAHRIMYFGLDKNKDNGNNNVAFWFLRGNASCVATSGSVPFTGNHQNGDVLVVSAFTNGGGVSNITAYMWNNGCIDNPSPQTPAACDGIAIGNGGDCKAQSTGGDSICATTNSGPFVFNDDISTNWLTSDSTLGVGHTVVNPDFFEGGIDLTAVFGSVGQTVPSCFNTFIADTRSSQSLTATLFDYARGQLGQCSTTLRTNAAGAGNGGSIGTGTVNSGTDTATLTINGTATWGGTLTWYLCGPVSTDGCDSHGVQITSRTVNQASPAIDFISDSATLTSVGRYCWRAHFEPNQETKDAGVDPADDNGVNECFTVTPVTPSLTTSASCTSTPCVLGTDTLSDTATLSGTATAPGTDGTGGDTGLYKSINATPVANSATISWVLYGPTSGGCTDTKATSPSSVSASVDSPPTYGPTSYKPALTDGVGVYTFVASYTDTNVNTNAATPTACPDPTDTEEVTVIGSASSASQQRWLPNDRIVLTTTGGTTLDGTLTVTLYKGVFGGQADNCTVGTGVATGYSKAFDTSPGGVPDASGSVYLTDNSTFFVGTKPDGTAGGTAGTYFWLIHYVDNNLTSPNDRCETSTLSPITD